MTNSYIGILTPRGLETLVVETEHAAPFLFRRAGRQLDGEAVCFWAVFEETTARRIMHHIDCQRFREALSLLNLQAEHFGALLPPLTEDDLFCVMS